MIPVLITGAQGFVGSYLAELLVRLGYQVMATGRSHAANFLHSAPYEVMDFTDRGSVQRVFERWQPAVVVHCGALSGVDQCEKDQEAAYRINVEGTRILLDVASASRSFFLFLSTDFVFDGRTGMYSETDLPAPVNYYGHTKLLAEEEVKKYNSSWSIARTVLVYGKPNQSRGNIVTNTAAALKRGERLQVFDDQLRTPTYVEDLAKGLALVMEKKAEGIFHLSGKDQRSPFQLAVDVANFLHLDASLIRPIKEGDLPGHARRPPRTGFNISKAERELGFKTVSFSEGLKMTLQDLSE